MAHSSAKQMKVDLPCRDSLEGHLPGRSIGLSFHRLSDLISVVHGGLSTSVLDRLAAHLNVPLQELTSTIGIADRTLARRRAAGKLSSEESERALRIANLFEQALVLFAGDSAAAGEWLRLPKKALNGASPLQYSATELGARVVENLIGRIEHGVFS